MEKRINVIIPHALYKKSLNLIKKGFFSSFSELVRQGLRREVKEYDTTTYLSEDEKNLIMLVKEADKKGMLLAEEEMEKYGLQV
jgi:Arc/MetJ-type ribon-helix-helix transcriptional regulator